MFCTNCRSKVHGHFCDTCGESAFHDRSIAAGGGLNGGVFVYRASVRLVPRSGTPWYQMRSMVSRTEFPIDDVDRVEWREPSLLTPGRLSLHLIPREKGLPRVHEVFFRRGQRDTFVTLRRALETCMESLHKTKSSGMVA